MKLQTIGAVLSILLLNLIESSNGIIKNPKLICYYLNWSIYAPGLARYSPQNVNPYLCTHIIYAYASFTNDLHIQPLDKYEDIDNGGYKNFAKLKTYNPNLKLLLAMGGYNDASTHFSPLAADDNARKRFAKRAVKYLRAFEFDGIDLIWQHPGYREGSRPNDKSNYVLLLQDMLDEFKQEETLSGRERLLLTIGLPEDPKLIERAFDVKQLNQYVDWFNLLSFDFHSAFEPYINHHAPLYSVENITELNVDYVVQSFLIAGADSNKIMLGIPTYGGSYTLEDVMNTYPGAPSSGPGILSNTTKETGTLPYYEICYKLQNELGWTVKQPYPLSAGPYAYNGDLWVGYDDEDMVNRKVQYAVDNNLGGINIWALNFDDFRGTCTGREYPLIEAVKDELFKNLLISTTTPVAPTTPDPGADFDCGENEGFRPHPTNTSLYYVCIDSEELQIGIIAVQKMCPSHMTFNRTKKICVKLNASTDNISNTIDTIIFPDSKATTGSAKTIATTTTKNPSNTKITNVFQTSTSMPLTVSTTTTTSRTTTTRKSNINLSSANDETEKLRKEIEELKQYFSSLQNTVSSTVKSIPTGIRPPITTTTTTTTTNNPLNIINSIMNNNNELLLRNDFMNELKNDPIISIFMSNQLKNNDNDNNNNNNNNKEVLFTVDGSFWDADLVQFADILNFDNIQKLFDVTALSMKQPPNEPYETIETIAIINNKINDDFFLSQGIDKKITNKAILIPKNGQPQRVIISEERANNHKQIYSKTLQ